MILVNKNGQALGRKGAESRQRLLDAALDLIVHHPAHKLTVRAISRAAGVPSQSFYRYFADIDEILLELSDAASRAMDDVYATLRVPWEAATPAQHGKRFVEAFVAYWNRHRPILRVRNYLADGGHPDFLNARQNAALPIIRAIAWRMEIANHGRLKSIEALARSVIIYSAIERMASRPATMQHNPTIVPLKELQRAEADILAMLFSSPNLTSTGEQPVA